MSLTQRLENMEVSYLTSSTTWLKLSKDMDPQIARWKDAPHLHRKVNKILIRPPPVRGHLQLFGFMISEDELLKLATIAFKNIWPSRELHDRGVMLFNACGYIRRSLRIPTCFDAAVKIPPGMEIPPECIVGGDRVQIIALWADADADEDCPWPAHTSILRRKIGREPRWWVDYHPDVIWRDTCTGHTS